MNPARPATAATLLPAPEWARLRLSLRNTWLHPQAREPMLAVWQALIKAVETRLRQQHQPLPRHVVIRPAASSPGLDCLRQQGSVETADILLINPGLPTDEAHRAAQHWEHAMRAYLASGPRNFVLQTEPQLETVLWQTPPVPACTDLTLQFHTPLAFKNASSTRRAHLQSGPFLRLLLARFQRFWEQPVPIDETAARDLFLLPWGWQYIRRTHRSRSQLGTTQWLDGCIGPLVLREGWRPWWPWIALAQQIGMGGRIGFGLGHFDILAPAPSLLPALDLHQALEQVLLRHDEAAVELTSLNAQDPRWCDHLREQLQAGQWQPRPFEACRLIKPDGSQRQIEKASAVDLVVHYALQHQCAGVFDRMMEPQSYGYRPGRSRQQAAQAIEVALQQNYHWVLMSDVADCFYSIDHARLRAALQQVLPLSDAPTVTQLLQAVSASYEWLGAVHPRLQGLPQGCVLSPLLANVFLDRFDEQWSVEDPDGQPRYLLVRYADDFIVLAQREEDAQAALQRVHQALQELGLHVQADKTRITHAQAGFTFLGMQFDLQGQQPSRQTLVLPDQRALYVTEAGACLGVSGEALEVRHQGKLLLTRPIARLGAVMALAPVTVSSLLLARLQAHQIPLVLGSFRGRYMGCVAPDSRTFMARSHRQALSLEQMGEAMQLAVARDLAATKIQNQIGLLAQRYRPGDTQLLAQLREWAGQIQTCADRGSIRGYEGRAARHYFERWSLDIQDPAFVWRGRRTGHDGKDAPDRINALLNFAYFLLYSRIHGEIRAQGLNPFLGFLHETGDRYETLVADVQELFRPHMDRLVLRLINLHIVRAEDFESLAPPQSQGVRMNREACKQVVMQFEAELLRRPRNQGLTLAEALYAQAHHLRSWLCDGQNLALYRWGS